MTETVVFPPVFDREVVLAHYLEALVWTGSLDYMTATQEFGGEPLVSDTDLDRLIEPHELSEDILKSARETVDDFLDGIAEGLEDYPRAVELTPGQLGHDFLLSRNGHGAGFWDRGLSHLGEWLHEEAKTHGGHYLMGRVVIKDPTLPSNEVLGWDNLDHDTLQIMEGC